MSAPHATAVAVADLVKTYRPGRDVPSVRALDGLTLDVPAGSVLALLGPNGAGKTTAVKVLSTLTRADSGRAVVAGVDVMRDPGAVRRRIGLVAQKPCADPLATGRENLLLSARLQGLSRADAEARAGALLDRFTLAAAADRPVKTYSGGMARKLDVALGLVHRPDVLFLDEPTTGLDPQARTEMWAEIERLAGDERVTVVLTTHYLDEADRLADEVAIVDHGRVVVSGAPQRLKHELRGDTLALDLGSADIADRAAGTLRSSTGLRDLRVDGPQVRARVDDGAAAVPIVVARLNQAGIDVVAVTVARPTLDDVYLRHLGRSLREAA